MINVRQVTKLRNTHVRFEDLAPMQVTTKADSVTRQLVTGGEIHELVIQIGANQRVLDTTGEKYAPPLGYVEEELQRQVHYYLYGEIGQAIPSILHTLLAVPDVSGELRGVIDSLHALHEKVTF